MSMFKKKHKKCTVIYIDQSGAQREELVKCRIEVHGIFIGAIRENLFIPMHRVLRIFIHE